jgi:serpin B
MFLINAIYYLGNWTTQFDKARTVDDEFITEKGESVPCRMMQMESSVAYQSTAEFQAVDLPYGDGHFRMAFILPNPGVPINTLIETLTPEKWQDWKDGFTKTSLTVRIPRFKLEWKKSLNDELAFLGMGIAFTDRADFSRINPDVGLLISQVLHKTFVRVDEEGTEAAAVTVVEVGYTSVPPVFSADRPFLFVLYESVSNTILFAGKLVQPVNP